ncbi:4-hydroxy-3-methylbut-2-enyl diphosphate reductase [Treponema zuelzerae]|uniref:4-hydroxy-3-methylbut-2-enyl diphosphate reductase n=1 Tax=Teretinema zuelzerae TaxID=156 RepID=A0AAE3EFT8_9SPIR|nr:4-hydroxy-3-methylbut-2-enyl diphosphate reductase [Teretinema zuelzerae]MCD1653340.1 4-hydroxy-3-methylbut-2-enyl diphosphate reductase [Teretinema zuelzerae]
MKRTLRIIRADIMGYCMGVRRAVEAAEQALLDNPLRPVYTYGPLIHNPSALERLSEAGVEILGPGYAPIPDDFHGRSVVVRAHGIPPQERALLESRHAMVVDATCPRVLSSQKRAKSYHERGYRVILAGDRDHGEIAGIAGYAPDCILLGSREDAENIQNWPERAVLISQTTIKQSEYDAIAGVLSRHITDLIVLDTICPATVERQKALASLAEKVEGILVVGGRESANTLRLFLSAQSLCSHAWHVETAAEIPPEAYSLSCIGITAGASTPDDVIDAVEQALQNV